MRLTLRTLLSWKDGMLAEDAARDLAAKVETSDAARRLVDRIGEVTGRGTLTAPAPDASGFALDANSTAEYLDNVLPSERLGEFERVCFASDAQLAETAACHEILATWSREPRAVLDGAARRRLLAAVRSRTEGSAGARGDAEAAVVPLGGLEAGARRSSRGPGTRPARAPVSAWLLVAAALLVLVALVGVLGWSLTKGREKAGGPPQVAVRGAEPPEPLAAAEPANAFGEADDHAGPVAGPAAPAPATAAAPGGAGPVATGAAATEAPAAEGPMEGAPGQDQDPAAAAQQPATAAEQPATADGAAAQGSPVAPTTATVAQRVPQGDAMAIVAPAPPEPAVAVPPPAPAVAVAGERAAAAAAVAGPAVLLHRPAGGTGEAWLAGVDGSPLELPVDLVAPPFGRPSVAVDGVRIALEPGTRAVLRRDEDGTPRLELVFGRAVAAGDGRLRVIAGNRLAGAVTAGFAAPVGIEVGFARPPGATAESTAWIARVMPSAGNLEWRQFAAAGEEPLAGLGDVTEVPAGRAIVWRSTMANAAVIEPADPPPSWLAGRGAAEPVDRWAAQAVARRLAAGTAAVPALRDLAADRRAEARVAAAATLALVGEFDALARLLSAEGRDGLPEGLWSRLDEAGVQPALARGPRAAEALERALVAACPPGSADVVFRFARGFSAEDLAAGAAAELVDALESPHLVVRRYASKNLVEITGADAVDRLRYRADRPAGARRAGVEWWRAQLDQGRIARAALPP